MVHVQSDSPVTLALPVYPVSAANKTALHFDKDPFSVNLLDMENNQPHWDLCHPECETSEASTLQCTHNNIHTYIQMQLHSQRQTYTQRERK